MGKVEVDYLYESIVLNQEVSTSILSLVSLFRDFFYLLNYIIDFRIEFNKIGLMVSSDLEGVLSAANYFPFDCVVIISDSDVIESVLP